MRIRRILGTALVAGAVAALGLTAPAAAYPPSPPSASVSASHLATLTVSAPLSMSGYSRDKFPHWIQQGNNCDTREVVLKRDGSGVTVGGDCYPTSGSWYSVYDSTYSSDPSKVQIDHIVPLADAWRSGAKNWTTSQRQAFANDLGNPQLIAVSAHSNESKGDQDPSQWMPSNTSEWCYYVRDWIQVKYYYDLTITSAEKSALSDTLNGSC